jgi:hypothetical protein
VTIRLLPAALAISLAGLALSGMAPARAATGETYGAYSLMFSRSAGQYFAGGQVAGQWAWSPQSATVSDISWGDPATWPPASAERFIRRGNWVELTGYSDGQGQPVTEVQRVTSDWIGDAQCHHLVKLPSDGGLERYVKWAIPAAGYCLKAAGTITSTVNGSVVHFRHVQQWSPPAPCSNAYFTGQTCISQHEQWWDDNGHPFSLQLDRTQYIALGLGMAFEIRQTYPTDWSADGRYYWTW